VAAAAQSPARGTHLASDWIGKGRLLASDRESWTAFRVPRERTMRGFLLLIAGAGLIALGFMGETEGTGGAPPIREEAEASTPPVADPASRVAEAAAPTPAEPEPSAVNGVTEAITGEAAVPTAPLLSQAASAAASAPAPERGPAQTPEPGPMPAGAVLSEPQQTPVFELVGPGEDPVELGSTLLEAWVQRRADLLGAYVNGEARERIPEGRRMLVAAFWQAMAGDRERSLDTRAQLLERSDYVSGELVLLDQALDPSSARARPASRRRRGPLEHAMEMVLLEDQAARAESAGAPAATRATLWSSLIHLELEAAWAPHRSMLEGWADSLRVAQESHRLSAGGDWPSHSIEVQGGDSLTLVRKRALKQQPGLVTCTGLMRRVNGVKKYIHPGQVLRVPTELPNVLVDLDARLVVYRHGEEAVLAWTCGIGKEGMDTPVGTYVVGEKLEEPTWYPPNAQPVPFGHPDNALGDRWIEWFLDGKKTSFGFHGTNDEAGVGQRVSRGCIRLRNDDVRELYELLPVGAQVIVQP
jgi:lipoprotein-anchoring transpeptidase ErfK/SrfK